MLAIKAKRRQQQPHDQQPEELSKIVDTAHLAPRESNVMSVTLIRSTRLFPDATYAYAAAGGQAGLVFTAGAMPLDAEGQVTAPGDLAAQMRQALANLQIALEEAGATIRDVLKTTVYVASSDRADLMASWKEVRAVYGDHDVPPGTCLGVAVLAAPGQLVEIEAIAALPGQRAGG